MNKIYQLSGIFLLTLISGCSCNRRQLAEYEDLNSETSKIEIIDPIVDSELLKRKEELIADLASEVLAEQNQIAEKTQTKARKANSQKNSEREAEATAHRTYPLSSYTDLEVINYDSGMKYQILAEGSASNDTPRRGQTVVTHYTCWHDDHGKPGRFVDSTYERKTPFEFKIGYSNVIRGWDEALMDMRIGDKRRLFIPSEMAFGEAGATELVPGNTDLLYEVELLEIK